MLVFKIAWRNILRHKGKSIIIGSILFLGALIMTLGNATAIGMQKGVEENIVRGFTGHIILVSDQETKDNVLFTPMAKPLKILKDYDKISAVLRQQDYVQDFIPMARGGVAILGGAGMNFLLTFGCNFDDFQRVFGSPVRGRGRRAAAQRGPRPADQRKGPAEPAKNGGLLAGPRGPAAQQGQPQQGGPRRAARPSDQEANWRWRASGKPTPRT